MSLPGPDISGNLPFAGWCLLLLRFFARLHRMGSLEERQTASRIPDTAPIFCLRKCPGNSISAWCRESHGWAEGVENEDGWYLVRASGTEPKIRITAEGKNPAAAKDLMEKGKTLLSHIPGNGRPATREP